MNKISDGQIEKLLEEVSAIKSVLNKNRPIIRQILLPVHFRLLYLISGSSIITFSLVFYLLISHYGSYSSIPDNLRNLIYIAIVVDWAFLCFLKYGKWARSLSKIDRKYTLSRALEEFFSFRIIHVYIPLFLLIIILILYLIDKHAAYYIVPTIAIGTGLSHNFLGSITEIRHYLIAGYWFLITGIGTIIFSSIPVLIALSVSLGCGLLLFGISSSFSGAQGKED